MRTLTTVKDVLLDPDSGKVVAFVVNESKNEIIVPMDVIKWDIALIIHGHGDIVDGDEVVRVERIQRNGRYYIEARVETESGEKLGKVYDLAIDTKEEKVHNLWVAKGILGLVRYNTRIISVAKIIEVQEGKIIVEDSVIKVKTEEEARMKEPATT